MVSELTFKCWELIEREKKWQQFKGTIARDGYRKIEEQKCQSAQH